MLHFVATFSVLNTLMLDWIGQGIGKSKFVLPQTDENLFENFT